MSLKKMEMKNEQKRRQEKWRKLEMWLLIQALFWSLFNVAYEVMEFALDKEWYLIWSPTNLHAMKYILSERQWNSKKDVVHLKDLSQ